MPTARPWLIAMLALCAAALLACGDDDGGAADTETGAEGECAEVEVPAPKDERFKAPDLVLRRGETAAATVETSCGSFVIELDTKGSPKTANSFAFLAEQGFYDGTVFHRIAPGFVIQGGDPKGDGTGGPGYSVTEAPPQDTTYAKGLVAMAKTAVEPPGTSGSQFFVVTAPADAGLPPDYAVLGEVTEGTDVVEAIGELGDPATEQPLQPVTIDSVTIEAG
ncbi:MAG: peptidyl-prolyl cis-trans isomerase cyclophilin type [Solirubrobacterales bacterium]|jgi:cyclophilin family peptidyl-prolyl cis-trans isomerase|nr:peptidyl-prolyl cis-trans isomerase cyclophilin type [Solirubrobacterales bacterium]